MPELSGRPLLGTSADARLYVERPVDRELERNARAGVNTFLVGERGAGKTSALRQLARRLGDVEGVVPVFVDGSLLGPTPLDLVHSVMDAIGRAPGASDRVRRAVQLALGPSTGRENEELVEAVRTLPRLAPAGARVIAIVDSLSSPEAAHTLFGRLRDELWQTPYRFVASADSGVAAAMLRPPADAFFEEILDLGALDAASRLEIAKRRLGAREAARLRPRLEELDAATPRRLVQELRHLADADDAEAARYAAARRERAARVLELGRPAAMLMAELEHLGPRSASDRDLLERLGWSRQRAAQVFRRLEDAGLVTRATASGDGGRPRVVFRPADLTGEGSP